MYTTQCTPQDWGVADTAVQECSNRCWPDDRGGRRGVPTACREGGYYAIVSTVMNSRLFELHDAMHAVDVVIADKAERQCPALTQGSRASVAVGVLLIVFGLESTFLAPSSLHP